MVFVNKDVNIPNENYEAAKLTGKNERKELSKLLKIQIVIKAFIFHQKEFSLRNILLALKHSLSHNNTLITFRVPQQCLGVFRQMARIPECKLQILQNSRFLTKHTLRHQALCYERTQLRQIQKVFHRSSINYTNLCYN